MNAAYDLWNRSAFFELRTDAATSYIFSLPFPPESFRFVQPQRVNRTKTFGGAFEDDYGLDNQKISLSGSVGGTDQWAYVENGQMVKKTSTEALFTFLDKIVQYKKNVKLTDLPKYYLRAWFLWVSPPDPSGAVMLNPNKILAVECSLDDFEFSQEQSSALRFGFKLELFVYRQLGTFKPGALSLPPTLQTIGTFIASLQSAVDTFKTGVQNFTGGIQNAINTYSGYIQQATALIASIAALPAFLASQVVSIGQTVVNDAGVVVGGAGNAGISVLQAYASVIGQINTLGDAIRAVYNLPATIASGAKSALADLQNQWSQIRSSYDFTVATSDPYVAAGLMISSIDPTTLDQSSYVGRYLTGPGQPSTPRMYANLAMGAMADLVNANNAFIVALMTAQMPSMILSTGSNSQPLTIYGTTSITTLAGDSFELVAARYLGDPGYAYLLAMLNNTQSLDGSAGGSVLIPLTVQTSKNYSNKVYSTTDQIGADIAIGNNGNLGVSPLGDIALTASKNANISQAITNRLNTVQGTFLRNLAYGLMGIGTVSKVAVNSILGSCVADTIIQDPRISDVEILSMIGNADTLEVVCDVTYSTGERGRVSGVLYG